SEKGTYEILLAATDFFGNQFTKAFTVTVEEKLSAGAFFLANDVVAENQPVNTVVGFFDSDIFQAGEYTLTLPLDIDLGIYGNAKFGLSGRTLLTSAVFDFESDSSFLLLVKISDGLSEITKEVTITVSDQNDPPTGISLSTHILNESTAVDSVVATLTVEDQDTGDAHVFSLIVGNGINDEGNTTFRIDGDKLVLSKPLDYEEKEFYNILLQATDSQGATFEQVMLLQVADDRGTPPFDITLSNTLVVGIDNPPVFVGIMLAEDIDQQRAHKFLLPINEEFGPDNGFFTVINNSLFLETPRPVTEKQRYNILVEASDSMGNRLTKPFLVTVVEEFVDGDFYLSNHELPENQPLNSIVGVFNSDTYDCDRFTFSLPLEVDLDIYCNDRFELNGRTLLTNSVFDFEGVGNVMVRARVSNGETDIMQDVVLSIKDQNDPPTGISLSTQVLDESSAVSSVVAILATDDQDAGDTHEFSLIVGNGINDGGNPVFSINGDNLVLSKPLNYEENEFHNILLQVSDSQGATFEQGLRLQVSNANDAPEFLSSPLSYVLQDQVYIYALDVIDTEGDPVTFDFESLPSWLGFNLASKLLSGVAGNDNVGMYNFSIKASDGNKESVQQVALTVIDVNDAPEINFVPGTQQFFSNRDNEIQLPFDCIIDPDVGDELTYGLLGENNTALPGWLNFEPAELKLSGIPPGNATGDYRLKLTATDQGNLKEWIIFILNVSFPTALGDLDKNQSFSVYPNPVKNYLQTNIPQGNGEAKISISNIAGQVIKTMVLGAGSQNKIPFDGLSPGVYFINFRQGEQQQVEKIIKQ
ncbi:MAG: T9SS type A sorting domain-containing protein, partial [Prolixibacteraceae bacterium]|nr:T9SS type A sorting domain-containing protein [Prolixibacteraceae bacterium]